MRSAILSLVLVTAALSAACTDATAMSRAQTASTPANTKLDVSAGSFDQGYQLGERNGAILFGRLRDRTVGLEGCSAMGHLESAILQVTRTLRSPSGDESISRGFFRGYVDALRRGLSDARSTCELSAFDDGNFAGSLFGAVVCRAISVSVDVAVGLELDPLFSGWAGGSDRVVAECQASASLTLQDCGQGDLDEQMAVAIGEIIARSCSDSNGTGLSGAGGV